MSEKNLADTATFSELIESIRLAHGELAGQASKAVNICLTLRNWLIGCYIAEYEQNGADRAQYGQKLIETLAGELRQSLDRCYTGRYLRLCRQFYVTYPQIRKSLVSRSDSSPIRKSLISKLPSLPELQSPEAVPATPPGKIIERLSFGSSKTTS